MTVSYCFLMGKLSYTQKKCYPYIITNIILYIYFIYLFFYTSYMYNYFKKNYSLKF